MKIPSKTGVKTSPNLLFRALPGWFIPRSNDPTLRYRERALRVMLPFITLLRLLALNRAYSGAPELPRPYAPVWLAMAFVLIPIFFSFFFLEREKIGWSGASFLLHWYLTDLLSLPAEGYWYAGFQISLILQIVLGSLLLPSRAILPFMVFQLISVSAWGVWLDQNYYHSRLLVNGQPLAEFNRTMLTLAAQETLLMLVVRYLRLEMEQALRLQRTIIQQLQKEIAERHQAEEQVRQLNAELEDRVRERTAELEAVNQELEAFSYSVSHDLRAPLRAMTGFARILTNDFAAALPEAAQNYLQKIQASGQKMAELIDELLDFSRLGRSPLKKQSLDLNGLLQTVIEALRSETENRPIEWQIADLPRVEADPLLIQQVLTNLVGNAVKYTRGRNPAQIEIGATEQNGATIYFVRDNGAGFDMQYSGKLFGVFQRLHGESEFEGTGIGLAIVQRILQRHGGRIWAEARVNQGAKFSFTLK